MEDYVHRVGRTARAGMSGKAYTLFTKKDFMMAPKLIEILSQSDVSCGITPALHHYAVLAGKA